jgi:hypothetical protein
MHVHAMIQFPLLLLGVTAAAVAAAWRAITGAATAAAAAAAPESAHLCLAQYSTLPHHGMSPDSHPGMHSLTLCTSMHEQASQAAGHL